MKTKIIIILIISGIAVSFGATKIGKSAGKKEFQSSATRAAEPIGGFVSEDH